MKVNGMDASERQDQSSGKGTDMVNTGRVTTTTLAALVIFSGLALVLGGCTIDNIEGTLGGYKHQDLSNSVHKSTVLQKAKELASSSKPEDWRTAAKNYGSLGMLDEMDECIQKYVEKEPEAGRSLIYTGEQIHKFYEGKRK
jgi:hypothetical protein